MDGDAAGSVCVAGAGASDDDGGEGVRGSPTPDLRPSSPALHAVDTIHYTIVNYYRIWDYIFFADAEQPWTAARRRRVPDDVSHTMFDGVIGSLLYGLPSWSTTLPLPWTTHGYRISWTTLNGLRTNWIPFTPLSFIPEVVISR